MGRFMPQEEEHIMSQPRTAAMSLLEDWQTVDRCTVCRKVSIVDIGSGECEDCARQVAASAGPFTCPDCGMVLSGLPWDEAGRCLDCTNEHDRLFG